MSATDTSMARSQPLPEPEVWRQARINRLLKELNANNIMNSAIAMQRQAIEDELHSLGYEKKRNGQNPSRNG